MKKFIFIFFILFNFAFGKNYNISSYDLMEEIHLINSLVFDYTNTDKWDKLMVGTVSAETLFGKYKGKSKLGITQISKAGLGYIKWKISDDDKEKLKLFGYDIDKVKLEDLEFNNELSLFLSSLYYKYKLNNKPPKTDLECAKAWKKFYNTYAGAGTVKGFIDKLNYHGLKTYKEFYNKEKIYICLL